MAAYQAVLVPALTLSIGETTVSTAPLTSGGLTVLQILPTLKSFNWSRNDKHASRFLLEATRLAWSDRLALLGDTTQAKVLHERLLSIDYADECAARVRRAVENGKPLVHAIVERSHGGTIHLCASDKQGNFAALTLTHGGSFGAQVTVEGLELTLGHGMSRFDPNPEHPNAPGPGKRPLNNMVPTILSRDGRAVLAIGGRGGRKIPNAVLGFLVSYLFDQADFNSAMSTPRMHTEGTLDVEVEKTWPEADRQSLVDFGYRVKISSSAALSGIASFGGDALESGMR